RAILKSTVPRSTCSKTRPLIDQHLNAHSRMVLTKAGHELRKEVDAHRWARADRHPAAVQAFEREHSALHGIGLSQNFGSMPIDSSPGLGGPCPAADALQQGCPEKLLQAAAVLADRRLGEGKPARRARVRALGDDHAETAKLIQINRRVYKPNP